MTDTAARTALAERVHPKTVACHRCGIGAPLTPDRMEVRPDQIRGTGEILFTTCADCAADTVTERDRTAIVEALGADPEDAALDGITVTAFADRDGSRPDRPNPTRWAHLDTESIAATITQNRTDLGRRQTPVKEGCTYCGVGVTPPGTRWKQEGNRTSDRWACGSCNGRHINHPTFALRDLAASVLVGFENGRSLSVPPNFGAHVGLLFAYEAGVKRAADRPWAHLDIPAMRSKTADLLASKAFAVTGRWDPDTVGRVEW